MTEASSYQYFRQNNNSRHINIESIQVLHKLDEIGNNANIGIRGFTT